MTFDVWLTDDAARDLDELFDFIAGVLSTLGESPVRGTFPKELLALGIREYREE